MREEVNEDIGGARGQSVESGLVFTIIIDGVDVDIIIAVEGEAERPDVGMYLDVDTVGVEEDVHAGCMWSDGMILVTKRRRARAKGVSSHRGAGVEAEAEAEAGAG